MSPPPGTKDEYSRGDGGSSGAPGPETSAVALPLGGPSRRARTSWARQRAQRIRWRRPVAVAVLLGALASTGVLVAAEFLTLYTVRVIRGVSTVPPVAAGTENHYALIPIAILAFALVLAAVRLGDRWSLIAVAVLGLIALLISLLHDLPDARRTGLVGSVHTGWVRGASSPNVAMYMETLGAVLLLLTAGLGLLFGEELVEEAPMAGTKTPFGVETAGPSAEGASGTQSSTGTGARASEKRSPSAPRKGRARSSRTRPRPKRSES